MGEKEFDLDYETLWSRISKKPLTAKEFQVLKKQSYREPIANLDSRLTFLTDLDSVYSEKVLYFLHDSIENSTVYETETSTHCLIHCTSTACIHLKVSLEQNLHFSLIQKSSNADLATMEDSINQTVSWILKWCWKQVTFAV